MLVTAKRRTLDSLAIMMRTRNPKLVWRAAAVHSLSPVGKFVGAGGDLSRDGRARYQDSDFPMPSQAWRALGPLTSLLRGGARLTYESETYFLDVNGLRFAFPAAELVSATSELALRFADREYDVLSVEGAVVIDVGANIGDSAIYFASRGAALVLGYEPFFRPWSIAVENVRLNHLEDRVMIYQAAIGDADTQITASFDPNLPSRAFSTRHRERGLDEQVQQVSFGEMLKDALTRADGRKVVCKMDCEGCEEEIFATRRLPPSVLQIAEFLIEVHSSAGVSIANTMRDMGFDVTHQPPDKLIARNRTAVARNG